MNTPSAQKPRASRSSLACLPCRARHLKCDAGKPSCARCVEIGRVCEYAPSRRGGLDRAALAERRRRLAAAEAASNCVAGDMREHDGSYRPGEVRAESGSGSGPAITSAAAVQVHNGNLECDTLVEAYYTNFHKLHPFILPRTHLSRLYRERGREHTLRPLIAVMRLIGNCYQSREWSTSLKEHAEVTLRAASSDPVTVQARLLNAIALFWQGHDADARVEMDVSIEIAIDLRMFSQDFPAEHGGDDSVVRESWRRTWWMLYIVEMYIAGTTGTITSKLWDVESTADLPCEEAEYESGEIPQPRSLQEFDCREFASEDITFSSFAYLVGATRCTVSAISTALNGRGKENPTHFIQTVDSILDGWLRLVPSHKKTMNKSGEIDELMFQAHLLIHTSTICLHRPLSDLKFNTVEDVSSCAREPPPETPKTDLVNVHTVRVLQSVEAQISLLVLPTRKFHHTPFVTCMTTTGTLALLSACRFSLKDTELAIARDQIRMTIGCLKELGKVWPRAARNVREIQTIAHRVLGLGRGPGSRETVSTSKSGTPRSSEVPGLSGGSEGQESPGSFETEPLISDADVLSSLGLSLGDSCAWFNFSDPDLPPWEGMARMDI